MVNGHTPNAFGGTTVSFGDGESVEVDAVVVSVGRRPFADQLGLDGTGVVVDERGFVQVDEYCRTGEPDVYAVGDLIATPQLAHVAYAEAILVVKQVLGESPMPVAYDRVPWAIYCHPEVAWAGPDEEQARAAGHDVVVAKHPFKFNSRAMILGETEGLVKIIAKKRPTAPPARCSACTWSARGSPSSSAAVTSRSTGKPPSTRSPSSSSRTRACRSCSAKP